MFGVLGCVGRLLTSMNDACLLKLGWDIRFGSRSLWCGVMCGKFARGSTGANVVVAKPTNSSLWKALVNLWPTYNEHIFWVVGNGLNIRAGKITRFVIV